MQTEFCSGEFGGERDQEKVFIRALLVGEKAKTPLRMRKTKKHGLRNRWP